MGRTKLKSKHEVLDICRDVFWCRGYGQTSMKDIINATGLQPGSLYHFFKNKDDLFAQVIDRYFETVIYPRCEEYLQTDKGNPKQNIKNLFASIMQVEKNQRFGCLMINTSVEVLHNPFVEEKLDHMFDVIEQGFLHQISRMREHKNTSLKDRKRLAAQLVIVNQGFWSLVRLGSSDAKLKKYIDSISYVIS